MLAGGAGERDIQMAQGHFGEVVLRGGGAQQDRSKASWRDGCRATGPASKLDELGIVDDFGALRVGEKLAQGRRSFRPSGSHQAERATPGPGESSNAGDARAEAFDLALAGIEREPDGDGRSCGCASRNSRRRRANRARHNR